MRWALVKVSLAVTAMVVVAFAVPLGLVIREMARDRAFSNAEREAAAVAPALSITTDRDQLERVVASAGSDAGISVHLPAGGNGGADIGRRRATDEDIAAVRAMGRASTTEVQGGSTLLQPVALSSGEIAVVEVYVPESEVTNGVGTAWAVLAAVGAALIVGSVAVADRLGVRMVQPAQRLAEGAHELGRASSAHGCRRRDRRNCASPRSPSTPWPTRWSSCWPTNGSWPPTSPTVCVPR